MVSPTFFSRIKISKMIVPGLTKDAADIANARLEKLFANYPTATKALVVADGNIYMAHEAAAALKHAQSIKRGTLVAATEIVKGVVAEADPATIPAPVTPVAPAAPAKPVTKIDPVVKTEPVVDDKK